MDIQHSVNGNQQLLNKLLNTQNEGAKQPQRQVLSDYSDKVSLSYQADKMKAISKEFFSTTIHSSQIPELTQKLYESGFISHAQYQQLGGEDKKISAISESTAFVNNWLMQALKEDDEATAKKLVTVADALININADTTAALRQKEADAFQIMTELAERLKQNGGDESKLEGIQKVLDVFSALAKVRNGEQANNAIAGYEQVEKAYEELLAQD